MASNQSFTGKSLTRRFPFFLFFLDLLYALQIVFQVYLFSLLGSARSKALKESKLADISSSEDSRPQSKRC